MDLDILKQLNIHVKNYRGLDGELYIITYMGKIQIPCSDVDMTHFILSGNSSIGTIYDIRDNIDNSIKSKLL
jgi:hypothetical protein